MDVVVLGTAWETLTELSEVVAESEFADVLDSDEDSCRKCGKDDREACDLGSLRGIIRGENRCGGNDVELGLSKVGAKGCFDI
jgi:hypothetical protein